MGSNKGRNQISILKDYSGEFEKVCKEHGITLKSVGGLSGYMVYEYAEFEHRKEHLLYQIKGIYESELIANGLKMKNKI